MKCVIASVASLRSCGSSPDWGGPEKPPEEVTFWLGLDERWALDRQRRQEDCLVERGEGGKGKTEEEIPKRGNRICKELEVLCLCKELEVLCVGVREYIP